MAEIHRRQVQPFYKHPELVSKELNQVSSYIESGNVTDGDDRVYYGDSTTLEGNGWKRLKEKNACLLGKRTRSVQDVDDGTIRSPVSRRLEHSHDVHSSPIGYDDNDEKEVCVLALRLLVLTIHTRLKKLKIIYRL